MCDDLLTVNFQSYSCRINLPVLAKIYDSVNNQLRVIVKDNAFIRVKNIHLTKKKNKRLIFLNSFYVCNDVFNVYVYYKHVEYVHYKSTDERKHSNMTSSIIFFLQFFRDNVYIVMSRNGTFQITGVTNIHSCVTILNGLLPLLIHDTTFKIYQSSLYLSLSNYGYKINASAFDILMRSSHSYKQDIIISASELRIDDITFKNMLNSFQINFIFDAYINCKCSLIFRASGYIFISLSNERSFHKKALLDILAKFANITAV